MGRRQLLPQTFSTEEAANLMQPFRTARRNHAQHSLCSPQLSTPLGRHLNCRQAQGCLLQYTQLKSLPKDSLTPAGSPLALRVLSTT
jgi:hypothetical protein